MYSSLVSLFHLLNIMNYFKSILINHVLNQQVMEIDPYKIHITTQKSKNKNLLSKFVKKNKYNMLKKQILSFNF